MSEMQKSSKMGLSEDSLKAFETAQLPGQAPEMDTTSLGMSNVDISAALRSADKTVFGAPYFMPTAGLLPSALPLVPQDIINQQQLLAQMQMLSFYEYQKKLINENRQKFWAEQERVKELEEKRMDALRLSLLKQKPKEKESAIASNEVKLHLRNSLMNKLKGKGHNQSHGDICESVNRSWQQRSQSNTSPPQTADIPNLSSSISPPSTYRTSHTTNILAGAPEIEFPIRKTASEPNLKGKPLPKQKPAQAQRNSPMSSRRIIDESNTVQETTAINGYDHLTSTASPPSSNTVKDMSATKRSFEEVLSQGVAIPVDSLYISMPNIPLTNIASQKQSNALKETEVICKPPHQYGAIPSLTGHLYQSPFQSSIAEEDYIQGISSLASGHDPRRVHPYLTKNALDQQIFAASQRHIRHQKPLSRTQSAPLPIVHPAAAVAAASLLLATPQQALLENQELLKQHQDRMTKYQQKKLIIGQLRQTLLQRSTSKNHMEQVDEESEARLLQEMQESREENFESQQQKSIYASHGSLHTATMSADIADKQGLDLTSPLRKIGSRHLARTHSSPLVGFPTAAAHISSSSEVDLPMNLVTKSQGHNPNSTGVVYDEAMLRHHCPCGDNTKHLENPSRIQSIWNRLSSCGLLERCQKVNSKKASIEQLQLCHTESYSLFFGVNALNRKKHGLALADIQFQRLSCGGVGVDADTVWNEDHSHHAARVAVGSVIELASAVYEKHMKNGMAIVRPPGHHSESGQALGFCFFNSVAIAAKHLKHKLGASKIVILDWDVHHGNGTQQMTYDDPCILYISLHRHDNGMFFPGTGSLTDCGEKGGLGFNVNIAFSGGVEPPMGDAEYMCAFRSVVIPIIKEFQPQIILVSAGFDGADGHPPQLGGYKISPAGFGFMTKQLMSVCESRVVLVLEGGYNLTSICDASEMCMRALLGDNVPLPNQEEILRVPSQPAISTLEECSRIQAQFWPTVAHHRSKIAVSFVDSLRMEKEESEQTIASPVLSMASSSVYKEKLTDSKNKTEKERKTEPMEES